jgi:hypothetical protein
MQGRFPRTVREFGEHGRQVMIHCGQCHTARQVPNDVLEAAFGPDFDLYAGYAALLEELRCAQCGEKRRSIDFINPNRPMSGDVSFEDSVTYQLEFRALVRARGQESTAVRRPVRRRR